MTTKIIRSNPRVQKWPKMARNKAKFAITPNYHKCRKIGQNYYKTAQKLKENLQITFDELLISVRVLSEDLIADFP